MPYTFTAVYIMFSDNYNFENLPNGFYKVDDDTIEMIIDYYSNGQRKKWKKNLQNPVELL